MSATNETPLPVLDGVREVLIETLDLSDMKDSLTRETELLGSLPGLDSMSVMLVLSGLSERFGFDVEEVAISGETFETLGHLADFVESLRRL